MIKKDLNLTKFNLTQMQDWQITYGEKVIKECSDVVQELYNQNENVLVYAYENKNAYTRYCILMNENGYVCVFMDGLTKKEVKNELENNLFIYT